MMMRVIIALSDTLPPGYVVDPIQIKVLFGTHVLIRSEMLSGDCFVMGRDTFSSFELGSGLINSNNTPSLLSTRATG